MDKRFINKIAVITGSAAGIGKAIACRPGKEGATVILFDINKGILDETVEAFKANRICTKAYQLDISNEKQVEETIAQIEQEWKKIDILVNSAGIVGPTSTKIIDYPSADFDKLYQVNLKGTFLITKYTLQKNA